VSGLKSFTCPFMEIEKDKPTKIIKILFISHKDIFQTVNLSIYITIYDEKKYYNKKSLQLGGSEFR